MKYGPRKQWNEAFFAPEQILKETVQYSIIFQDTMITIRQL